MYRVLAFVRIRPGTSSVISIGLMAEGPFANIPVERSWLRAPGGLFGPSGMFATVASQAVLRIANSLLEGGSTGTITCFQNYDANFAPVTC